jgi:hypothetical protein
MRQKSEVFAVRAVKIHSKVCRNHSKKRENRNRINLVNPFFEMLLPLRQMIRKYFCDNLKFTQKRVYLQHQKNKINKQHHEKDPFYMSMGSMSVGAGANCRAAYR